MSIQWQYMYKTMRFFMLLSLTALFLAMTNSAQAGGYYYGGGYGHHGYGYGHYSGHGYGYGHHNPYRYGGHGYSSYGYPLFFGQYYSYNFRHDYDHRNYYAPVHPNYSDDALAGSSIDTEQYDNKAWRLLARGQTDKAFTYFSRAAQAAPSKGSPKIGYALAAADLGQLDKGIWAMRRALRIDPHALHYVTLNNRLDAKVRRMITDYEKRQEYSGKGASSSFMLASLHYLRRDMESAQSYINQAMLARHVKSSTKNLNNLINREING